MDFSDIISTRQSCRKFDNKRPVDNDKLNAILASARLAPSACNGQPYHITVCTGETAKNVATATQSMGMNKFASDAPVMIVISEKPYVKSAAVGAKLKNNDYRSIDIGIMCSHIVCMATELSLSTCILGWFDDKKVRELCDLSEPVRLVVALGYCSDDDKLRTKKRKSIDELVSFK